MASLEFVFYGESISFFWTSDVSLIGSLEKLSDFAPFLVKLRSVIPLEHTFAKAVYFDASFDSSFTVDNKGLWSS